MLERMGVQYGTDKVAHGFCPFYDKHFRAGGFYVVEDLHTSFTPHIEIYLGLGMYLQQKPTAAPADPGAGQYDVYLSDRFHVHAPDHKPPAGTGMTIAWPLSRFQRTFFLLACLLLISLIRLHTLDEPIEADEAIMALVAADWLEGGRPYVTTWENKPIGAFAAYSVAFLILGQSEAAIRILSLVFVLAATCLLFLSLRRLYDDRTNVIMMLAWIPLSSWTDAHYNGTNAEVFLIPFLLGAFLWGEKAINDDSPRSALICGFILILSLLFKQVTAPFLLIVPFLIRASVAKRAALATALGALVVAVHLGAYAAMGYPVDFLFLQMKQNVGYASHAHHESWTQIIRNLAAFPFSPGFAKLAPLFFAGMAGAAWNYFKRRDRQAALILAFSSAAFVGAFIPGWNRPHYAILILPFLPLLLPQLSRTVGDRRTTIALSALLLVYGYAVLWTTNLSLDPRLISKNKYDQLSENWFLRDRFIGREMLRRGYTSGRAYVFNNHPGIIFYSRNRPAVTYLTAWMHRLPGTPDMTFTVEQLKSRPPEYIVIAERFRPVGGIAEWMKASYSYVDSIDGAAILKRGTPMPKGH